MNLLSEKLPLQPVIGCLAEESVAAAVSLMHRGVFTVVSLPPDVDRLSDIFRAAHERSRTLQSEQASGKLAVLRMERATRKEREVLDLILQGISGRLVSLRQGLYDNVPINTIVGQKKLVDVAKYYNTERLRPTYETFQQQSFFSMTSET